MTQLHVRSPVALPLETELTPARRGADLAGRRIGLYWNIKAGGDVALRHASELLGRRFEGASFVDLMGSVGVTMRHLTQADAEQVVASCDVVVGTTGDCGSCTSWLMHDMVLLERLGIPTVAYVSETFVDDARHSAHTFGLKQLPLRSSSRCRSPTSPPRASGGWSRARSTRCSASLTIDPDGSDLPGVDLDPHRVGADVRGRGPPATPPRRWTTPSWRAAGATASRSAPRPTPASRRC